MREADLSGEGPGNYLFSGKVCLGKPGEALGPFRMSWPLDPKIYGVPEATTETVLTPKGKMLECRVFFPHYEQDILFGFRFLRGATVLNAQGQLLLEGGRRRFIGCIAGLIL